MRADGSIAYVSDRGILLRNDSGTYRMIGAMQDITHLKENEIAITQLNQNLEKHIQKLAESNEELERFAYVASHDLQEPLRMVTSFMQLLKSKYSDQLDATAQKYIHFAVDGASRMKTLIHDLLEISRIGSLPAVHREINTTDVIRKTLAALKRVLDESQAKINVLSLPVVYGNESQLLQLFQNLISNAIKYTANVIPEITISWSETPGEWQFCVADNGIGIDPQSYEKIFIIFQRLHNQKDYTGTGIGLAICKKIIELHGGKIWVESSKGNGSKFYFTILKMQTSPVDSTKLVCSNLANNS
jgi:two-component system CheB/CheR fusion protein